MAAPPPPRELVDDVIPEILLRIPPDEPKWLFRAALVCKPWLRAVSDPGFLHRYRAFHGAPPLLGLIDIILVSRSVATVAAVRAFPRRVPRFVAVTTGVPAFPIPESDTYYTNPLDCRHGRILINKSKKRDGYYYLVCDPITGDRHRVASQPPDVGTDCVRAGFAVFCAVTGCQHLDCHGGPVYVALMFTDLYSHGMFATTYSSEMGAWSALATLHNVAEQPYGHGALLGRGALLGEGIYFPISGYNRIVKYDWGKNCLAVVKPPPLVMHNKWVALTEMKDSSLGLAAIKDSSLYLWSRAASSEENAEWVQCRVIDLEKMIPMANPRGRACVVGFAEGVAVVFINTDVGLFMMELNSGRVKKVGEPMKLSSSVLPYMSFYTPDRCRLPLRGGPGDL